MMAGGGDGVTGEGVQRQDRHLAPCAGLPFDPLPLAPPRLSRRGISNTAGTLAGVVGVAATGALLQAGGGAEQLAGWYQAVGLAAVLCVLGSGVFLAYARGERLFGGDTADFS